MTQTYETTGKGGLFARLTELKNAGYMLAQILATAAGGGYDALYVMERGGDLISLRVALAVGEGIESVTGLFPYAYLYENEMKDLFGIGVANINVDFKGSLYKTAVPAPFGIKGAE